MFAETLIYVSRTTDADQSHDFLRLTEHWRFGEAATKNVTPDRR